MLKLPTVAYSANVRLGGGGMGSSLLALVTSLHRAQVLQQVIVSSYKDVSFPTQLVTSIGLLGRLQKRSVIYDPTGWSDYFANRLFDAWASRVIRPVEIFESWTGFCELSLMSAKALGMQTYLGHGSAHPHDQIILINTERELWGLPPIKTAPNAKQLEREFQLADTIIVQSSFSEQSLRTNGVSAEKITRLPPGVNTSHFFPAPPDTTRTFRVLFLGQVTLRKGLQYLLEAWKRLAWRDAELWVVGKVLSDSKPVLNHYAGLPGLHLTGYVPDQLEALQKADVFVAPSVEDGFGHTVIEAMACGLPVVASANTGASDLVRESEGGFVVPYNSVDQYAMALEKLRSDTQLRHNMGQAALARAQKQTWDMYQQQALLLYSNRRRIA